MGPIAIVNSVYSILKIQKINYDNENILTGRILIFTGELKMLTSALLDKLISFTFIISV
jgi:hypothetical protein